MKEKLLTRALISGHQKKNETKKTAQLFVLSL